ncbi:stress response rci peptide like [Pyrenophora seminiperda CCB06]|uniref:Stress response rci peptide like n=1 Tax=Pyrenophora seminiperda CCB06 TaxID=1302712 RepID=A0A3M7M635_9PLEO|nr:stress response rci peptide like [Pyrenophora seminiperda CCB06]
MALSTILLYILAIWVPFVTVWLKRGCKSDLLINVALCFLAWLPGIIHAWYIIHQSEKAEKAGEAGVIKEAGEAEKGAQSQGVVAGADAPPK